MLHLIEQLKQNINVLDNFEKLGDFVRAINIAQLQYTGLIPDIEEEGSYGRNILMMQPIEAGILHWPPGVESAIHHHEGFYGYVIVLKGQLDNIEYVYENGQLKEMQGMRGMQGGILPERDGVVHKLANLSADTPAITLHIYYPPLESFEGMRIFDIGTSKTGVLSAEAKTASWVEPDTSFSSIQENAFTYFDFGTHRKASHRVYPLIPKPSAAEIYATLGDYYNEQALEYDDFDTSHEVRNAYVSKLNAVIAADFAQRDDLQNMLALACGTGRRTLSIKELSGKEYHIVGVDLSSEMTAIAREKGIEVYNERWLKCELKRRDFDAVTFLYAFGHICSRQERKEALQKIHAHLKTGAPLYLDVFNMHDTHEWGPAAVKVYNELGLENMGYEKGDVFYKKCTGTAIAFLHYFDEGELRLLLEECGFAIEWVKYIGYTYRPGEELTVEDGGKLFIKAVKV